MNNKKIVSLYLAFMCVALVWNSVGFFNDQIAWAIVGGVFSLLFFLSAIGSNKDNKSFLWLGIICVAFYTLYTIGAVIWALFSHSFPIFLLFVVVIFTLINAYAVLLMSKRLNYNS
ncbi:hypothetical protein NC661_03915 [Aquibacillus koreensis]|uniref:Uncharacterized protein n=1 Tax=Aquibacillus koreensis TaxID=279446 RepID=A0A9X3WJ22_9BACI|nr:hypothetical protein [Aquibacillus koreensis]MCT2534882.1 hypothetical protein [Aquibacillus koreensis]MDC3419508.1 hypothetical protein [Aquibacillus koreensis]